LGNKKQWLKEIDIIKALAIILIVLGHLHFFINLEYYQVFLEYYSSIISFIGLSLFFFVSGFSLYYNYSSIKSFKEIKNYYYKRAVRIFPLFWFETILLVIWTLFYSGIFINDKVTLFTFTVSILGLQGLVTNYAVGFFAWFIGVLLLYYFIYPFIVKSKNIFNIILMSTLVLSVFLILNLKFNLVYKNFFMYYWIFVMGILICWVIDNYKSNLKFPNSLNIKNITYNLFSLILTLLLLYLIYPAFQNASDFNSLDRFFSINAFNLVIYTSLIYILARITVFSLSKYYPTFFQWRLYDLIKEISFSTYAVFLFHGLVLTVLIALIYKLNLNLLYQNLLVIIIGIPAVFISGYYIQKLEVNVRHQALKIKEYIIESWEHYKNEIILQIKERNGK